VFPRHGAVAVGRQLGHEGGRSLDKGIYEATVQWDTFRRTMSAVTNISQACVGGLGDSVGGYERNRMLITGVVTHKFWFSRFMLGVHK
jgi:hypothetical protein